jgi:hypothetical protein
LSAENKSAVLFSSVRFTDLIEQDANGVEEMQAKKQRRSAE